MKSFDSLSKFLLFIALFFLHSITSSAQQTPTIEYSNEIAVTGLVYVEYFYEEKNYGETPEEDAIRGACILKLDAPIELKKKYKVEKAHLIFSTESNIKCSQLEGHRIQVIGSVEEITTGHQHGDAILIVSKERILR